MSDNHHLDVILENKSLRREFAIRDLDPEAICHLDPDDPVRENHLLKELLAWVDAYRELGNRQRMEEEGFDFPPVEPDLDPEADWLVFERWMAGLPTSLELGDPSEFFLNPDAMDDEEIAAQLKDIAEMLERHSILIDLLSRNIPVRLVYEQLRELLSEFSLPLIPNDGGGAWHIDGCSGCCPECFQRPWCESGWENVWPEDLELGRMALPECLENYVCATPFSLELLGD